MWTVGTSSHRSFGAPRPFDGVTTFLFLRKNSAQVVPYCTFVLAVGNECYQVFVPCPEKDQMLLGKNVTMPLLPTPYHGRASQYGASTRPLFYDLSARDVVRDQKIMRIFSANLKAPTTPP